MNPSEQSGRFASWLMQWAMKVPGGRAALWKLVLRMPSDTAHGLLRKFLARDNHALLKALLFEEDSALFRRLAVASAYAPLKALLFEDDYRVLKELLSSRSHEALKAVMLEGDPAWFSMIVRAQHAAPLSALLFEEDAALLRHVLRLRGVEALVPLLETLGATDRVTLASALLFSGEPGALELVSRMAGFERDVLASARLHGMIALWQHRQALRPLLPEEDSIQASRFREATMAITQPEQVRARILDVIAEGDLVVLARGTLRFPCRHSLWTLLHEILVNEDYYFDCKSESPVIIDGGAHMGMAIYYFKTRYPGARITAFEPDPALQALALENVARNGWEGVEILPCALAGSRCDAPFHVSEAWSMAGSLSERRSRLGDAVTTITVPCVPLSDYLHSPVDFLKLDIEGAELEVLEEAAPWLFNVAHIVCEVHQGGGVNSGTLIRILALLEAADFEVQVGKSHNYQVTSRWRPFTHFDGAASLMVWARNRR